MGSLSKGIVSGMGMGNHFSTPQPTRVIAVTSGKGGVGKTTVSINLAVALATLGRDVVLLDADLGLANVDVLLGLHADRTLMHVVAGECSLADVIVTGPAGVRIVPAASGFEHMAELGSQQRAGVIAAFSQLEHSADFMIVDTAAGIGGATLDFCDASHEVLVVVCDDPASMTDAYATIKVLNQRSGRRRFRVLVNNTRDDGSALRVFRRLLEVTDRYLDVSLDFAGQIPHDAHVRTAARRRQALLEWAPASRAGAAFKNLANTTDKWPVPRGASGRMEFFVERMARMDSLERVASL